MLSSIQEEPPILEELPEAPIEYGKAEILHRGKEVLILAVGSMVETALEVRDILEADGRSVTVVNMRFVKPFDEELVLKLYKSHKMVVTMEEGILTGGLGQQIQACLHENGCCRKKCINVSLPNQFIEHGTPDELKHKYKLDTKSIVDRIKKG